MRTDWTGRDVCARARTSGLKVVTSTEFTGLNPGHLALDASDADIATASEQAGLLPLLMAVFHITGDLALLREAGQTLPPQFSTDMSGNIAPDTAARLRRRAAEAIRAWRDAGCPSPHAPDPAQLREMIDRLTGKQLEPRYAALLSEELGFQGDERAFAWDRPVGDAEKSRLPVLIIGAGLSGLLMGYRLKQAGIPFTIVEKNAGPGGTWYENRFPGARVDVPSPCYSYSFVRDRRWPDIFSPWTELRRYFAEMVETLGLASSIHYDTQVTRAVYDATVGRWNVTLQSSEADEVVSVAAVVSAVGQLNRPSIPQFAGQDEFQGVQVHTSRWPEGLSVKDSKVVVVGTAATALQIIPELAEEAAHLTVFQRSPTWVFIHPEYRRAITQGEQWAIDHLPGFARWMRLIMYNWADDGQPARMRIDPDWPSDGRSVSAQNEKSRVRLTGLMKAAIGDNPELAEKLIPTYPPYVKRPNLGDGGYFRAMSRSNVSLVTDGISRFTANGVVDNAGVHHEADVVVYATGFRALEYLAPMEIVGRGGQSITDFWGDEPRAYLGMTVPQFPNLFLMYGPGTNLGYNGNLFFNAECQARYIANSLKWMIEDDLSAIEVRQDVYADYASRMDEALAGFTWSHGGAGNWYKNKAGKVIANSPWPLIDYWEWTRAPDEADFGVTPAAA